jgi:hypothetical protein
MPMTEAGPRHVSLKFAKRAVKKYPDLPRNLSAVEQTGDNLWLGSDEGTTVERLTKKAEQAYGAHESIDLTALLTLPAADQELDIEGLAFDGAYLWLTGSHSLKRDRPRKGSAADAIATLGRMVRETNRYVLGRIPCIRDVETGEYSLHKTAPDPRDSGRTLTAAQLFGTARTNLLIDDLDDDHHLARFLSIPGKENGFDIEGLAVSEGTLFLGLRGPVVRGWAVILQIQPCDLSPAYLSLDPIGPKHALYRKHFLDLGGLGVRDVRCSGDDLLILAGPTMDLDGRVLLYRWPGGARVTSETIVERDTLEVVLDFPLDDARKPNHDHPEGVALLTSSADEKNNGLLIVYDSPDEARCVDNRTVLADLFVRGERQKQGKRKQSKGKKNDAR